MSSLNVVKAPLDFDLETGEELLLLCDWEKHLHPGAATGYRVTLVKVRRGSAFAHTLVQRDFVRLPAALRFCASVATRYEPRRG